MAKRQDKLIFIWLTKREEKERGSPLRRREPRLLRLARDGARNAPARRNARLRTSRVRAGRASEPAGARIATTERARRRHRIAVGEQDRA